jgi:hypothetical protein
MGVLHNRAQLGADELELAAELALPVLEKGGDERYFRLPCSRFDYDGNKCGVYPKRPRVCGEYQCDLLKGLLQDTLSLEACLDVVEKTRRIVEAIGAYLGEQDRSLPIWEQISAFSAAQAEAIGAEAFNRVHARLLLDVKRLAVLCGHFQAESFKPWAERRVLGAV